MDFPSLDVPPQSRLIVFASGKNRSLGDKELHTNFMLDSNGEYLALIKPDGKTINSEYNYPKQKTDVSYGISFNPITNTIVSANTPIKWLVPASPIIGWGSLKFDSSEWNQGAFGVGYDTSEDYEPFFQTDVKDSMRGIQTSVYIRSEFQIDDPNSILKIGLKCGMRMVSLCGLTINRLHQGMHLHQLSGIPEQHQIDLIHKLFKTLTSIYSSIWKT